MSKQKQLNMAGVGGLIVVAALTYAGTQIIDRFTPEPAGAAQEILFATPGFA